MEGVFDISKQAQEVIFYGKQQFSQIQSDLFERFP